MTDARASIPEIKARALANMLALARDLAPDRGTVDGFRYIACNPTRADSSPGSFVIDISGPTVGRWVEFAAGATAAAGEGGDVIDLVAYVQTGGVNFKLRPARAAAIQWLAERYGLATPGDKKYHRPKRRNTAEEDAAAERARAFALAAQQRQRNEKAGQAASWWLRAGKPCAGTATERYLTIARGLPMHAFAKWPGAIRHLPERVDDAGEIHSAAMFCAMTATNANGEGETRAVHRTFLTEEGIKDPDASAPRKMWGDPNGAAIRVSKGGSYMTPEQAAKRGERKILMIGEGVEDALVAALLFPDRRVWAAGDVGKIGAIARLGGWPACASEIVLFRDNDPEWLGDAETGRRHPADAAIENALQAFMDVSLGRPVSVMRAIGAHDLNDLWLQTGRAA